MHKSFCATAAAALLCLGNPLTAAAAESTIEMQAIRDKSPGPMIGTVHAVDTAEGLALEINLTDLPPGPNRLFVHDSGDCALPPNELLSNPLVVIDVDITEDGAEPLKKTLMVPGRTLAEMSQKALVVHRGSQTADLAPAQTALPRLVACGVVK